MLSSFPQIKKVYNFWPSVWPKGPLKQCSRKSLSLCGSYKLGIIFRKWLPNIRKLSQSKLEKSQSLGGHDAKNINRQIYKANFKVSLHKSFLHKDDISKHNFPYTRGNHGILVPKIIINCLGYDWY